MKTFAIIAAIIAVLFGLGMIVAPYLIVSLYGTKLDVSGQFMARYFGSALLGLAVVFCGIANNKTYEQLLKGMLFGGLVFGASGLIVSVWDRLAGTHNFVGWLNIIIYAFFTIGFAIYYFKKGK